MFAVVGCGSKMLISPVKSCENVSLNGPAPIQLQLTAPCQDGEEKKPGRSSQSAGRLFNI